MSTTHTTAGDAPPVAGSPAASWVSRGWMPTSNTRALSSTFPEE